MNLPENLVVHSFSSRFRPIGMTLGRSPVATTAFASGVSAARSCWSSSSLSDGKGGEGDAVGALLDVSLERSTFRRQLPIGGQQTTFGQPGDDLLPLDVVVVAGDGHHVPGRGTGGDLQDVGLSSRHPGRDQRRDVAVAAVLAQERGGVPEHVDRFLGPRERGVGGEQRSAIERRCSGRPSGQFDGRRQLGVPCRRRRRHAAGLRSSRLARASSATSGGAKPQASGSAFATRHGEKL